MRVISKFSDYYDSVQSFDKDADIYMRKSKDFNLSHIPELRKFHIPSDFCNKMGNQKILNFREIELIGYREFLLGFCGVIYILIEIHFKNKINGKTESDQEKKKIHLYNQNDLDYFLLENGLRDQKRDIEFYNKANSIISKKYFKDRFEYIEKYKNSLFELFQKLNTPIFIMRREPNKIEDELRFHGEEIIIETNPLELPHKNGQFS